MISTKQCCFLNRYPNNLPNLCKSCKFMNMHFFSSEVERFNFIWDCSHIEQYKIFVNGMVSKECKNYEYEKDKHSCLKCSKKFECITENF